MAGRYLVLLALVAVAGEHSTVATYLKHETPPEGKFLKCLKKSRM